MSKYLLIMSLVFTCSCFPHGDDSLVTRVTLIDEQKQKFIYMHFVEGHYSVEKWDSIVNTQDVTERRIGQYYSMDDANNMLDQIDLVLSLESISKECISFRIEHIYDNIDTTVESCAQTAIDLQEMIIDAYTNSTPQ